jgi:hypothetical protein
MPIYKVPYRRVNPDPENEPDFYAISRLYPVSERLPAVSNEGCNVKMPSTDYTTGVPKRRQTSLSFSSMVGGEDALPVNFLPLRHSQGVEEDLSSLLAKGEQSKLNDVALAWHLNRATSTTFKAFPSSATPSTLGNMNSTVVPVRNKEALITREGGSVTREQQSELNSPIHTFITPSVAALRNVAVNSTAFPVIDQKLSATLTAQAGIHETERRRAVFLAQLERSLAAQRAISNQTGNSLAANTLSAATLRSTLSIDSPPSDLSLLRHWKK